jgi:hypothetical protein
MTSHDIAALRLRLNLTQEEFGRLINASTWTISRWENNAALPDLWHNDLLLQMHRGFERKGDLRNGERIREHVRAGRVGLALGILLGAALRRHEKGQ